MSSKKAIPQAVRRAVAVRYGCEPGGETVAKCEYCPAEGSIWWPLLYSGRPGAWVHFGLHLDHVVAESLGGTSDPDNIVLACKSCNSSKRDKDVHEWSETRS